MGRIFLRVLGAVLLLFFISTLIGVFLYPNLIYIDSLKFSNTQVWDESIYSQKNVKRSLINDPLSAITLSSPPKNSSSESKRELRALHDLINNRTSEKISEINREVYYSGMKVGDYYFSDFVYSEKPYTKKLFNMVLPEFKATLLDFKEKFDRVRPSFLDTTLTTSIEVPGHPSYPSGHSAESFFVAILVSKLDPKNAEIYFNDALRTALNREIAGVHYRSDTEAGRELAHQYFNLLLKNDDFVRALESAKAEWKNN